MNLATFLATLAGLGFVTASPMPTGLAATPVRALLKRAHLTWDPPEAYQSWPARKQKWEERCNEALAREDCVAGIIHQGQTTWPHDGKTAYVNVEGSSSMDMKKPRKMLVFEDGRSEKVHDWSPEGLRVMLAAKRRKKNAPPSQDLNSFLIWDPADTYEMQFKRKEYWEHRCHQALSNAGCQVGIIHKGEVKVIKDGQKTSYVKVVGAPFMDMENSKKLRVYQDASSEDFSKHGWTPEDRRSMRQAKDPLRSGGRQPPKAPIPNAFKHSVSWDPPNAYKFFPRMREAFEHACHKALDREGCDFGTIYKRHRGLHKADGTKSFYMTVAAGKKDDPDGKRYMQLYENGSSVWYPPSPLPNPGHSQASSGRENQCTSTQDCFMRPIEASTSLAFHSHNQDNSERQRIREGEYRHAATRAHTPPYMEPFDPDLFFHGGEHSPATQAHLLFSEPSPGLFHALRGDEHRFAAPAAHTRHSESVAPHPGQSQAPSRSEHQDSGPYPHRF